MLLEEYIDKVDGLDEVLDYFILNLPENYDEKMLVEISKMADEIISDALNSELLDIEKLVIVGLVSAMMEYAIALIETF